MRHVQITIDNRKKRNIYQKRWIVADFHKESKCDAFWERDPSTIYGSYIHLRKNLLSWKKLGTDSKIAFPVLGTLQIKEYMCGYSFDINMVHPND